MAFVVTLVAVIALLVGVPLAIVALAAAGPIGWIIAAIVLPVATLAAILWLGRERPGDGEPTRALSAPQVSRVHQRSAGRVEAQPVPREPAQRPVPAEPRELTVHRCDVEPRARRDRRDDPPAPADPADHRAEYPAPAGNEPPYFERGDEGGVAGARAQHGSQTLGAGDEQRRDDGPEPRDRRGTGAPMHGADEHPAEIGETTRPGETATGDERDVRRQIGRRQAASGAATIGSLDRTERDVPRSPARREQPASRRDVDEALDAGTEPAREELREPDLVAARKDHLSTADHAGLERRQAQVEGHDERGRWRRGGRSGSGRRRGRRVGARGDVCEDERRADPDCREEAPSHAARSQSTSTGVPWTANAYMSGASRAIIRTQPWDAGYVGTGQYSCIAIPPVK